MLDPSNNKFFLPIYMYPFFLKFLINFVGQLCIIKLEWRLAQEFRKEDKYFEKIKYIRFGDYASLPFEKIY